MKKMSMYAAAFIMLTASATFAVDLSNQDSKEYPVRIITGSTTVTSINSSTTQLSVCSECDIEVEGVGKVHASGSEKVVIKDGALSKE